MLPDLDHDPDPRPRHPAGLAHRGVRGEEAI